MSTFPDMSIPFTDIMIPRSYNLLVSCRANSNRRDVI